MSAGIPNDNPVDAALPLVAISIAGLAFADGRQRNGSRIVLAIPVLLAWRLGVPEEHLRILLYGVTVAGAAGLFVARAVEEVRRTIAISDAIVFLLAVLVPARFLPFEPALLVAQTLAVAGTIALAMLIAERGRVPLEGLIVCLALGLIAPLVPLRASLVPVVVAAAIWMLRAPTPFTVPVAVGATALAGKWAIPILAAVSVASILVELVALRAPRRSTAAASVVVPIVSTTLSRSAGAAIAWFPEALGGLGGADPAARVAALLLGGFALVMRPALATIFVVTALALVLLVRKREAREDDRPFPLAAVVFSLAAVALCGFSGAVTSRFPLPVSLAAIIAVAAVAMPGVLVRRFALAGSAIASFAFLAVLVTQLPSTPNRSAMRNLDMRFALETGEMREIAVPDRTSSVRLVLSGGHLVNLAPDTPLCSVEARDGAGREIRLDLDVRDAADWGGGRRDHFFTSRNEWPVRLAGVIAGFGHEAFLPGSSDAGLDMPDMRIVRVTAARSLPANARLIVESVSAGGSGR